MQKECAIVVTTQKQELIRLLIANMKNWITTLMDYAKIAICLIITILRELKNEP